MNPEQARQRIEDLEWMAAHGESLNGAARRLGLSVGGVESFCVKHKRVDLSRTLRARNPQSLTNPAQVRWSA